MTEAGAGEIIGAAAICVTIGGGIYGILASAEKRWAAHEKEQAADLGQMNARQDVMEERVTAIHGTLERVEATGLETAVAVNKIQTLLPVISEQMKSHHEALERHAIEARSEERRVGKEC